jgi:N-acetylglucosaminyldiphosphoundecaprenol N-acetyl-beta-D-mannosaminyltransferase
MTTPSETVLTTRLDGVDIQAAGQLIERWAHEATGRIICAANVHMVMEARDDPAFGAILNSADLVVADGRPLVWACRLLGQRAVGHVRGLDLTARLCEIALRDGLNVGLYGGAPSTVQAVRTRLLRDYDGLSVTLVCSPPFRPLSPEEDATDINAIRAARVQVLLVGLGCPKQERWMAVHRDEVSCAMVGVGAVFDMLAGQYRVAPLWVQRAGLEWTFRLLQDPRRLWRRYAKHNFRFVVCFGAQWVRAWWRGRSASNQVRRR